MKKLLLSTILVSLFYCNPSSATKLTEALERNAPLSQIQSLIKDGENVNQPDDFGLYPLMLVKDTATFFELVNAGADINAKTKHHTVFHQACANGTLEMVQYLVKSGANVNEVVDLGGGMKHTPLMDALHNKDPKVIEFLIQSGADVKREIPAGLGSSDSALKTAIILDVKPEIIEMLIKNGANIYKKDKYLSSFYEDIVQNSSYPELIPMFQKAGLDFGKENLNYLFSLSMNNRSLAMAKYLLELGADPNVQPEHVFMGRFLKEDYPIITAVKASKPDILKILLERKVNVNVTDENGRTPLQLLQKNNSLIKDPNYNQYVVALGGTALPDTEVKKSQNSMELLSKLDSELSTLEEIQKLIQDGADVNFKDRNGRSALMKSLEMFSEKIYNESKSDKLFADTPDYNSYVQKHLDRADLLLKNGADINTKNGYGESLLSMAVQGNQPMVMEYLLKKGIDVNASDDSGKTALMEAARFSENPDIVRLLLQYGADETIKDSQGQTAAQYAIFNSNQEIRDLLKAPSVDFSAFDKLLASLPVDKKGIEEFSKTMIQDYANSILMDAALLSNLAVSANQGQGQDMSATEVEELNNKKIACGAKLFAKKDGTVSIDFPDNCERREEFDEIYDISVDDVIDIAKKDKSSTLTCIEHHCIWKDNNTK